MDAITEKAFGCVRNTIRLRSGRYFDLADPKPDQFTLADIAGALSKICRFGGQVGKFYSVAQHSVLCADQAMLDGLPLSVRRAALMHDAAEAFTGDIVKPLKVMLPEFAEIERRVEYVVNLKYGLLTGPYDWDRVKEIDRAMLMAERRMLFSADQVEWTGERDVRRIELAAECYPPEAAERAFLKAAAALSIWDPEGSPMSHTRVN